VQKQVEKQRAIVTNSSECVSTTVTLLQCVHEYS